MICIVCSNTKDFEKLSNNINTTNNYLCHNCGLVFIPRNKNHLHDYYKEDGYFQKSPNLSFRFFFTNKELLYDQSRLYFKEISKILNINPNDKKILDIGCGFGEKLYFIKNNFKPKKVLGIEPSKEAAINGEKMFNIQILPVLLDEFIEVNKEKFDIIISNHVLEHISDPNDFLSKVSNLLSENGLMYIEVPNVLKPSGNFPLQKFFYYEHLQTFNSYNISKLFVKHNLVIINYSDEGFLKFWLKKGENNIVIPPRIEYFEIKNFLENYAKKYSIFSYSYMYLLKFKYLIKFIYFKISTYLF